MVTCFALQLCVDRMVQHQVHQMMIQMMIQVMNQVMNEKMIKSNVVFHQNKKYKFYLSTDDGVIEDNSEVFQDFCDFLEETFEIDCIDIDDWPENLQLFSIENVDDIDNTDNQIECGDDFGDVFENCNLQSDDPNDYTVYFVFKTDNDDDDENYGADAKKNERNEQVS